MVYHTATPCVATTTIFSVYIAEAWKVWGGGEGAWCFWDAGAHQSVVDRLSLMTVWTLPEIRHLLRPA